MRKDYLPVINFRSPIFLNHISLGRYCPDYLSLQSKPEEYFVDNEPRMITL